MNRRARGTMRVVAVVVRPCDWKSTPAANFKLLPEDGRTLQEWRSVDAALLDVVRGIRRVVASVRKDMAAKVADAGSRAGARASGRRGPTPGSSPKPGRPGGPKLPRAKPRSAKPSEGKPGTGRRGA